MKNFVRGKYVQEHISKLKVVDASMVAKGKPSPNLLPNAIHFNVADVSEEDTWLPNMLPSDAKLQSYIQGLGLDTEDHIVIYDNTKGKLVGSARVWFMLKQLGFNHVNILDGGLSEWPSGVSIPPPPTSTAFKRSFDRSAVWSHLDVRNTVEAFDGNTTPKGFTRRYVLDARSEGRFRATEPEPREDICGGSIPHSINVPFTSLLEAVQDGSHRIKSKEALHEVFEAALPDYLSKPIVTSCGSGITACTLLVALSALDHPDAILYDGSWTEWGTLPDTPKVVKRLTAQDMDQHHDPFAPKIKPDQ